MVLTKLRERIKILDEVLKFLIGEPRRYKNLFRIIRENKLRRIMEIGTWNGEHAVEMIRAANSNYPIEDVEYYGFDLFEMIDDKTIEEEFAKKQKAPTFQQVKRKLDKTGCKVFLYKGNTRNVLPKVVRELPIMDFIFIDGGHSIETIKSDWKYAQKLMDDNTFVIFDDFYNIDKKGCRKIVENLDRKKFDVEILAPKDKFEKEFGTLKINMVKISRR